MCFTVTLDYIDYMWLYVILSCYRRVLAITLNQVKNCYIESATSLNIKNKMERMNMVLQTGVECERTINNQGCDWFG